MKPHILIALLLVSSLTFGLEYEYNLPQVFPYDNSANLSGRDVWYRHINKAVLDCGDTIYAWPVAPEHIPAGEDWKTVPDTTQYELIDLQYDDQICSLKYYFASGLDYWYATPAGPQQRLTKPVIQSKGSGCSG